MADTFNRKTRSWIMSRIKGQNTKPEQQAASLFRKLHVKFRRNVKTLPGSPDFVLVSRKKVIFIHGCFWHGHKLCQRSRRPTTNRRFWNDKIDGNIRRDLRVKRKLRRMGWDVLAVWECRMKDERLFKLKVVKFLSQKPGACIEA